jgi:hypothetical protein
VTTESKPGKADHQDAPPDGSSDGSSNGSTEGPSEFKIGLVTFIIFLIFMAIWMYFRTAD